MKAHLILLFLWPAYFSSYAQQLFPYKDSLGKYGFNDMLRNNVIPASYVNAHEFSEDLAAVALPDSVGDVKWGFIDKTGKTIIPFYYAYILTGFKEGRARVMIGDVSFYIDQKGNTVIDPDEDDNY